ncbi:hypothetical protein EHW97_14760 [Aeromicrobium camelliae]|uniref:Uncharacterized protein n=1 Tax=Aeromicrobium camelliae TaxID=1538144 RepID=A0A3N6WL19_9ACTN|nr:hypothetical protein [Aeromicrobium camelliae]RQN02013.1 hypothetical protein EHW97_14760 [Aeromicrobium camelliae]
MTTDGRSPEEIAQEVEEQRGITDAPVPEVPGPEREHPDPATKRGKLVENVRDALAALPAHFASRTFIEGLEAGDLFSLNSMLGGSIEIQVVQTLNRLRAVWDPDEEWEEYSFVRSAQTFPDVRLATSSPGRIAAGEAVGLGLELKGWYLLSREGEPSFRYTVSRDACDVHDLLVVVPWHLSNVLAGDPVVYAPYVESARYAADMRNHYWSVERRESDERKAAQAVEQGKKPKKLPDDYYDIRSPQGLSPYPAPKTKTADVAAHDGGSNFGRVARASGLMDDYVEESLRARVAGIEARHWVAFFKAYAEGAQKGELHDRIMRQIARQRQDQNLDSDDIAVLLREWVNRLPGS